VLELLFLAVFWSWVFTAGLFLRNTHLPRLPITTTPASLNLPFEAVRFPATDGVQLAGWKIAGDPKRPWIIFCHGLGTNRADLLDLAAALFAAGYNSFLFDFRAHGESQGSASSFGWLEQRDLKGALAFLGTQPDIPDRPYGVLGVSMGGAVVVMVAAEDERLGAVAVDSIYTNLEESLARHLKLLYRLPRVPFMLFIKTAYRLRFGAWPAQMSPLAAVPKLSPRALLVIHGEADIRMPTANAQEFFRAAKESKELWIVPHAGHLETIGADPHAYTARLARFFQTSLKP